MSEAQLLHDVLLAWGSHPRLRLVRMNTGAVMVKGRLLRFGFPGMADIMGVIAPTGRTIAIECKSQTGKQRKAQEVFQRVLTQFGGVYVLARSVVEVDRALADLGITR